MMTMTICQSVWSEEGVIMKFVMMMMTIMDYDDDDDDTFEVCGVRRGLAL